MPKLISNKTIIDLSRIIVGPYATNVLSGFGCNVIKVQSPEGDPTRLWGPPYHQNTSTYYESVNFNKKSISLDLKSQKERNILYKLIQKSDAVVQNFVPGVTKNLKIDYNSVKKYNQKLVYCSISGYGDIGSKKNFPAFDNIIQAQAGFMHLTGSKSEPFKLGFAVTDVLTGLYASNAILGGFIYQQQTGKGIHLKTSLYQCAVASLINQSSNYLNGGINPNRLGNHHPNIVPYGLYQTSDKPIIICVGTPKQYEGLMNAFNIDITNQSHKQFLTNELRVKNRAKFDCFLTKLLSNISSDEILTKLDQFRVPCGKVNDLDQVFNSNLAKELQLVQQKDGVKVVRNPIRTNQNQLNKIELKRPPNLNQQQSQILEWIGMKSKNQ